MHLRHEILLNYTLILVSNKWGIQLLGHKDGTRTQEFMKFLMNGTLYQGSKPVMWSVVQKTALAEAEIEYEDHKSVTIYARFPIIESKLDIYKSHVTCLIKESL